MTTQRWENQPTAKPFQLKRCNLCGGSMLYFESGNGVTCYACLLTPPAELAPPRMFVEHVVPPMHDEADYASVCADRDRYIARCAELETRLEKIREVLK